MSTIIEKHYQDFTLTKKEERKQKILFLNFLSDLKTISSSLPESKKELFNKTLSLILLYYPENWKQIILKNLQPEIMNKLIEEERKLN